MASNSGFGAVFPHALIRSWSPVFGIDLDPMSAQERSSLLAIGIGNNQIRLLHGHVTVHTTGHYFLAEFGEKAAGIRPVAL